MNSLLLFVFVMAVFFTGCALCGGAYLLVTWLIERNRPTLPAPDAAVGRPWDQKHQTQWLREIA
jgi:hypothetical protein